MKDNTCSNTWQLSVENAHKLTTVERNQVVSMLLPIADGKVFTGICDGHSGRITAYVKGEIKARATALDIEMTVPSRVLVESSQ